MGNGFLWKIIAIQIQQIEIRSGHKLLLQQRDLHSQKHAQSGEEANELPSIQEVHPNEDPLIGGAGWKRRHLLWFPLVRVQLFHRTAIHDRAAIHLFLDPALLADRKPGQENGGNRSPRSAEANHQQPYTTMRALYNQDLHSTTRKGNTQIL